MVPELVIEGTANVDPSVLDEDLSFLAAQAAIELDMLMSSMETKLESVSRLSQILTNRLTAPLGTHGQSCLDAGTIAVLSRALDASRGERLSTVEELIGRALDVAGKLSFQRDPNKRNGELVDLKKFCVALARCAAAYRESVLGTRAELPYRR